MLVEGGYHSKVRSTGQKDDELAGSAPFIIWRDSSSPPRGYASGTSKCSLGTKRGARTRTITKPTPHETSEKLVVWSRYVVRSDLSLLVTCH